MPDIERSTRAPLPRAASAQHAHSHPPPPLVHPTGHATADSFLHLVDQAAEPVLTLPQQAPLQRVVTAVTQLQRLLSGEFAVDAANLGIATVTNALFPAMPAMPAATVGAIHVGIPHVHAHPPYVPLPSIGTAEIGGCFSVLVNGQPALRCGDLGMAATCLGLSPVFEIETGSSNVFIGGARAARAIDFTRHCAPPLPLMQQAGMMSGADAIISGVFGAIAVATADSAQAAVVAAQQAVADLAKAALAPLVGLDPGTPPCHGMLVKGSANVLIGGIPLPPLEQVAQRLASRGILKITGRIARPLHSLNNRLRGRFPRLAAFLRAAICFSTGHPIDVATGKMFTSGVDLALPGPLPLELSRHYASTWADRDGPLGRGWSHSFDQAVWVEEDETIVYLDGEGREIEFDLVDEVERLPWLKDGEAWDPHHRLLLRSLGKLRWEVETVDGVVREFGPIALRSWSDVRQDPPPEVPSRARLKRIRDRSGNAIRFDYDELGHLSTVIDSAGRELRFEHDDAGRLHRVMGPHPHTEGYIPYAQYAYSEQGDLVEVKDAVGACMRFAYQHHLMVQEINKTGLNFFFEYDGTTASAKCVHTWGDGGIYARKLEYLESPRVTVVTKGDEATTTYFMTDDYVVTRVVDEVGAATTYAYDGAFNRIADSDALGGTTARTYDARGNLTKLVRPDGSTITAAYDRRMNRTRVVDAVGGEWTFEYDGKGRLVVETDPLGETTAYTYSSRGQLISVKDPTGHATLLAYDDASNLTEVNMPTGGVVKRKHDRLGRVVEEVNPWGGKTRIVRDALGRPVMTTFPDGDVLETEYDPEGNVIATRNRARSVRLAYTGFGKLSASTEAGNTVRFVYDGEERLTEVHNELGEVYRFEHDLAGRVLTETGFSGGSRRYARDKLGRVIRSSDPTGAEIRFSFDAGGRVKQVDFPDGDVAEYQYRADGALVAAKNAAGTVTMARDLIGRIVREKQPDGEVVSTYAGGERVRVRSSLGAVLDLERDPLGNPLTIAFGATSGGNGSLAAIALEYDRGGAERRRAVGTILSTEWKRDLLGRPLEHRVAVSGSGDQLRRTYQWGPGGRISAVNDSRFGELRFEHDLRGGLVAEVRGEHVERRAFDAAGNIFRSATGTDRRYGRGGVLQQIGDTKYQFDAAGRLVERRRADGQVWRYRWNGAGMLSGVERPDGKTVSFTYDALGRRLSKRVADDETRWVWDGDVIVHELTPAGQVTWYHEPERFAPLAKVEPSGRVLHVTTDHLGTPISAHDEVGRLAWAMQLDSFGVARTPTGEKPNTEVVPFRWPGQYEDSETGLYYNRFRYYDAEAGRFLSEDPIRLRGGLNLYAYPGDPVAHIDPHGLSPSSAGGGQPAGGGCPANTHAGSEAEGTRGAANWKSVKAFQHTFTKHGQGVKVTRSLTDTARSTGKPQGQWLNNDAAAQMLQGHREALDGPASIAIPDGMGQVIMPDGSIVSATRATLVPRTNGFVTAYPIP